MASTELPEAVEPKKNRNFRFAFTCAIFASMACIILGYDIGVMSGAAIYIKKDLKITDVQLEILIGVLNLYSLIGSFAAGRTSDWMGRRFTVVFAAAIFFTGALVMGFAVNYGMLMAGRFVAGVGVGYTAMIAPVYTAEVSPASARGFLTSFPEVFINFGILLGYVSNYAFARLLLYLGWRVMLGIGAAPSVLLAFMVFAMPESSRWLVMKGRLADARAVLEKTTDTPEEAAQRLAEMSQVWKELILSPTPAMRRILFSVLGLHFFQQASGIDSVVLYSPRVFQTAGITNDNHLRRGRDQDVHHPDSHVLVRQGRPAVSGAEQQRRDGRVAHRPRDGPYRRPPPPGRHLGRRSVHHVHPGLRLVLLHRPRPHRLRVHLGDLPAAGACAGVRGRRGVQPRHQRRGLHGLPVTVEGHNHRRQLLPLLGHHRRRVGVLLHLPPRDPRPGAGVDGQAVRHGRHGPDRSRKRRLVGEGGGASHEIGGRNKSCQRVVVSQRTRAGFSYQRCFCRKATARSNPRLWRM